MTLLRPITRPIMRTVLVPMMNKYGGDRPPVLRVSEVGTVSDDLIVLTYSQTLDNTSTPATGDYSLTGTSQTITSVAISGMTVRITLSGNVVGSDIPVLDYTAGVNPVRNEEEIDSVDFVGRVLINNTRSQYIEYSDSLVITPPSTIYDDKTTEVRKRILGTVYYVDVALTGTGFAGTEDIDWVWVLKYNGQNSIFRSGVRDGDFVVDATITGTGFAGTEDIDWEELYLAAGGGVQTTYRDGVRDAAYVIDKALTATGFTGTEDVDWENLRTYKPE